MLHILRQSLLAVALTLVCSASAMAQNTVRAFHIGNSVTDTLRFTQLRDMVNANPGRGKTYVFGRHTIPGSPLEFTWNNPTGGFGEPSFYNTALPNNDWNVLTLQPFDRSVNNDQDYAQRFINLMRTRPGNANAQVYIYQRWPRRENIPNTSPTQNVPINYPQVYNQTHVLDPNSPGYYGINNLETKGFYDALLARVRQNNAGTGPVPLMIPVGDVLQEIDARLKAGQIRGISGSTRPTLTPGILDVNILYPDGIHFGNLGQFIVGTTFYATMFKDNPVGLVVPASYKSASDNAQYRTADFNFPGVVLDPSLPTITNETVEDLQAAIWHVVSNHPNAGIPEPAAMGAIALVGAVLMKRRTNDRTKHAS